MTTPLEEEAQKLVSQLAEIATLAGWTPEETASALKIQIEKHLPHPQDQPDQMDQASPAPVDSNPLTLLRATNAVQQAATNQVDELIGKAKDADFSWAMIGRALGITAAAALRRWQRIEERGESPRWSETKKPEEPLAPEERGWRTAASLGRLIRKDQRTVRAMAERGEIESLEEAGRKYFRMPPSPNTPDEHGDLWPTLQSDE
ncbi:hypothetical protein [Glutamicibacter sp. NPDC087583]|uniref:hypothetical protein n=1 Tax=Glutamicibacter sp. NPDC087583 TaxID=3363995 RepID=UPI00381527EA